MAQNESRLWQSPRVVPGVVYDDVPKAIEWLTRAFGFRERSAARLTGKGFVLSWMEIGDGLIGVSSAGGHNVHSPESAGKATQSIKVYVDDVDRHYERAKAAGAEIIGEIEEGFWGGRYYRAADPEGHHWEFSQIGRELSADQWKLPPGIKMGV
ncbi:MAG: VOC family protein [Candidatus Binataceae bacterium]